jgi:tRNA dimethylallyltransferase
MKTPVFIAGPTAVGKSAVALLLAEQIGGEIISVDSMQVYRGLDIGTAKPSPAERSRVPHHLIDVVEMTEPFDAAKFVQFAQKAVAQIQSKNHVPIFCGGTGLYFKAFLDGLGDGPPADEKVRAELEATPMGELLRELEQCDPVTFARIDKKNPRRVIRAIEVIRVTGRPYSEQRANWKNLSPAAHHSSLCVGFTRPASDLNTRISGRVDKMFADGLVNDTKHLLNAGLAENKFAMQAIGYRQVVEHLNGERSLDETIELVKIRTRQFAKRQMTWFRRQMSLQWIEVGQDENPKSTVQSIAQQLKPSS